MSGDKKDEKKEESSSIRLIIPECCREGWDSCPHRVGNKNEDKKVKKNVGL